MVKLKESQTWDDRSGGRMIEGPGEMHKAGAFDFWS